MDQGLLATLRASVDTKINEILLEIAHCAYYQFSESEHAWRKSDIQGPLFIVKRTQEPHNSIVILNKQRHNNFIQPITADLQIEKKIPQLLLLKDSNNKVHGIWFPIPESLDQLFNRIEEIRQIDQQSKTLKSLLDIGCLLYTSDAADE